MNIKDTYTLGGDLTINRMGYGAMRITGQGIWGPPADRDEAIRVLRALPGLGVNFIDTADSYGPDVSEELIAEALYPYPKGMVIATKEASSAPARAYGRSIAIPAICGRRSKVACDV